MQTVISDSAPFDDVLLREEHITITSSRLEINKTTYALKYIAKVTLSETHPPRSEARTVLILALCALVATVVYLLMGKMTFSSFLIFAALALLAMVIGGVVYWVDPSSYTLNLKLINGETVKVSSKSERFIHRVHQALSSSLAMNHQAPVYLDPENRLV